MMTRKAKMTLVVFCAALCVWVSPLKAAPIFNLLNGELVGASGINIGGQLYDVAFLDTPCTANYSLCTRNEFAFKTQAEASFAANALNLQIFTDAPSNLYDVDPAKTLGCESAVSCEVLIPYLVQSGLLFTAFANNLSGTSIDSIGLVRIRPTDSLSPIDNRVFARFSLTPIPEPYALVLLFFALLGMRKRFSRAM